jgi:hypothetical protein
VTVICEHHTVPHEAALSDRDSFANEAVTTDFAAITHRGTSLNLNVSTNCRTFSDRAAVEVDE